MSVKHLPLQMNKVYRHALNGSILHPLAITKAEMVQIGGSLLAVAAVFIAYAIIAKAVNSL
jgi:hypothetical protein